MYLILPYAPSGEDILLRNDRTLKTMYILTEQVLTLRALPGGGTVKFLDDNSMYLGNQVQCLHKEGRRLINWLKKYLDI